MIDRKDVVDGLIMLKRFIPSTMWEPINGAIPLLKEQEVVKIEVKKINNSGRCGRCPNCLMELNEMDYPNFCGNCGQAVKWNDD